MRRVNWAWVTLASATMLVGCQDTLIEPAIHAGALGGPALTLQGTVRSALDGSPVAGAKIRLYAPGAPYTYPFTLVSTETTSGGAYLLRLPTSFRSVQDCLGLNVSARALGFDAEAVDAGVLCTPHVQEVDFDLNPAGFGDGG